MSQGPKGLLVLPASLAEAPRSDEYDVNLLPDANEIDPRDGEIVLPDKDTVTVAYTAGADTANTGEAMVARGPAGEVQAVLNRAGYLVHTRVEAARFDEINRRTVEIARGFDINVRETPNGGYEVRLASADAVDAANWDVRGVADEQQKVTSALASGLWQLMTQEEQNDETDGPVIDSQRSVKLGAGRYVLHLGSRGAQSTLERAAEESRRDRAEVIEGLLRTMLAIQLLCKESDTARRRNNAEQEREAQNRGKE